MLSPMDSLVRGSLTFMSAGLKCLGRSPSQGLSLSLNVRPLALSRRIRR